MTAIEQVVRGWLGSVAHLAMAIVTLSALGVIMALGLGQPGRATPLYGELLLDRALSTLSLLPAVVVLALLSLLPYRQFRASASAKRMAYFHLVEAIVAASAVCVAIWLVGSDNLEALL